MLRHLLAMLALCCAAAARGQDPPGPPPPLPTLGGVARDATGGGIAFVELEGPRRDPWAGELATVVLRVGFEERFLGSSLVPLFPRALELPVEIDAPALLSPDGAVVVAREAPDPAAGRARAVLGGEVVELARAADRVELGGRWTVHELAFRLRPTRAGTLFLGAPRVTFAFATRFDEDLVRGRVAAEREVAFATGAPLALRVIALPEEGRPPEFGGAVGRFTLEARAEPAEVALGEGVALTLSIEGDGDLAAFEAPRLADAGRFDLRGTLDRVVDGRREVVYDLAPRDADVRELPAVELAYFDPAPPAGYRVARARPIAIAVRPAAGGLASRPAHGEARGGAGAPGGPDAPDVVGARSHWGTWTITALAIAAGLVALALRRRRTRA